MDSFTAAMVVGLLRKLPLEIIHKNAINLASYVCTQKGATPKLSKELVRKLFIASAI
jgi:fructokinase